MKPVNMKEELANSSNSAPCKDSKCRWALIDAVTELNRRSYAADKCYLGAGGLVWKFWSIGSTSGIDYLGSCVIRIEKDVYYDSNRDPFTWTTKEELISWALKGAHKFLNESQFVLAKYEGILVKEEATDAECRVYSRLLEEQAAIVSGIAEYGASPKLLRRLSKIRDGLREIEGAMASMRLA